MRSARSQAARGNAARSGTPGDRSMRLGTARRASNTSVPGSAGKRSGGGRAGRVADGPAGSAAGGLAGRGAHGRAGRVADGRAGTPRAGRERGGGGDHPRPGPAVPGQLAVLDQALVGLGDHAAGHAQLLGQHPGGREPAADGQPAVADGGAQVLGQPVGQAAGRGVGPVELEEVGPGYGPANLAAIGPVHRTIMTAESAG